MAKIRLYLNITNHCNARCPFCCMYSSPDKKTFMSFDKFMEISRSHKDYELQLEGGEPLLHPEFDAFLKSSIENNECKKIIILTNALNIRKDIERIINLRNDINKTLEIKASINTFLMKMHNRFLFEIALAVQNIQFIPNLSIKLNVRKTYDDGNYLEEELSKYNLLQYANVFNFNRYGRLKDDDRYGDIVIKKNIDTFKIFASDGTCFEEDVVARSEYENELN